MLANGKIAKMKIAAKEKNGWKGKLKKKKQIKEKKNRQKRKEYWQFDER